MAISKNATSTLLALALTANLGLFATLQASEVGIKNYTIGMTLTDYKKDHPDPGIREVKAKCSGRKCTSETVWTAFDQCRHDGDLQSCRAKDKIAGIENADVISLFYRGIAVSVIVTFPATDDNIEKITSASGLKFGKPSQAFTFKEIEKDGFSWFIGDSNVVLSPRLCNSTYFLNSPRNVLAAAQAYSERGICTSNVLYGNDVAAIAVTSAPGINGAAAGMNETAEQERNRNAADL